MLTSLVALALATSPVPTPPPPASFAFPGDGPAWTDYLVFDPASQRVWVPAGCRGETYAFDVKTKTWATVKGFATAAMGKRVSGPSSVTFGPNAVYVGNRADSKVCAVDRKTMQIASCGDVGGVPDGVQYVTKTQEVWVTTPKTKTLTLLSTTGGVLKANGTIAIDGSPEGFAVDDDKGVFYTNDEDGDRTYAIDVKTRKVTATYASKCGGKGPRGLIFDAPRGFLYVGCSDGASVLNLKDNGAVVGHIQAGEGIDTIDYSASQHALYLAAGRAGKMFVVGVNDKGALALSSQQETADGIRAVVLDVQGNAYLPDSKGARLLMVGAPR